MLVLSVLPKLDVALERPVYRRVFSRDFLFMIYTLGSLSNLYSVSLTTGLTQTS
jgi:hypothetical protein